MQETSALSRSSPEWRRQLAGALTSARDLVEHAGLPPGRLAGFDEVAARYPVKVTPYYASLIDPDDPDDPIARMVVPDPRELEPCPALSPDPLGERQSMPTSRLIRRYRDRVLLIATSACAVQCRHCTRKWLAGQGCGQVDKGQLEEALAYLRDHPEVREVLVSGGDPLVLDDDELDRILSALRSVPTVELLRVGTRIPVVLPMRVTGRLVDTLARHQPLFLSTHFNHPRELSTEAMKACARLAEAGIPVVNQAVLLAGVNDSEEVMAELGRRLLTARIRPYYLFQCDLVEGVEHLRTPLDRGMEIVGKLRRWLSGLAIPTLVVDTPDGGKIPLGPEAIVSREEGRTLLRNPAGKIVVYPDPGK